MTRVLLAGVSFTARCSMGPQDETDDAVEAYFDALMDALIDMGTVDPAVSGSIAQRTVELSWTIRFAEPLDTSTTEWRHALSERLTQAQEQVEAAIDRADQAVGHHDVDWLEVTARRGEPVPA
ncbi:MAG TPA: hypothetical protein VM142_03650 [Acidimicrobiales bacterium]|nr:hypothetical protein [Acidimicrobiales bacterium]